jgi:predicted phage terminase large subunit-like protein
VLSEADRKAVIDWWCNAMSSRDNDPLAMSRVIVMQRLHLEDLTGYVLANEDYEHLCLPMRYDSRRHCSTSLGWEDPRKKDGELLWPERFPEAADAALRKGMRSKFIAAAQLEQDPQPLGGSIVQQDWIRCWQDLPPGLDDWVQSWDMAFKGKSDSADGNPAYVVGQVWARRSETYYLIDQVRGQWDIVETIRQLRHLSRKWPQATKKMIEDKASGPAVMQLLRGKVAGLVARNPDRDKKSRLHAVAPFFEGGCVYIPHPDLQPWVDDWVYEITTAPQCHYWDQIDSMTQALLEYQDEPGFVLARG